MFRTLHHINPSRFHTLLRVPTTFIRFRLLLCEPLYPWFLGLCLLILPALSSWVSAVNFPSGDPVIRSHVFPRCQNPLHLYGATSRTIARVAHFKLRISAEQPQDCCYLTNAMQQNALENLLSVQLAQKYGNGSFVTVFTTAHSKRHYSASHSFNSYPHTQITYDPC
jgi:hypothetical protein